MTSRTANGTKGLFITFEGVDGCGKSTQAVRLAEALADRGVDVVHTREPGGTDLGRRLRELLLGPGDDGPVPVSEMLLLAADRAQHVERVIKPALARGAVVVSDRFIDSSIAYQAGGLGLPLDDVRRVNLIATGGLWPRRTIWLDLDPRVGLERVGVRSPVDNGDELGEDGRASTDAPEAREANDVGLDRIERRGVAFQERVLQTYAGLAAADPERWIRIDVTGKSVSEVETHVLAAVEPLLREAGWSA